MRTLHQNEFSLVFAIAALGLLLIADLDMAFTQSWKIFDDFLRFNVTRLFYLGFVLWSKFL